MRQLPHSPSQSSMKHTVRLKRGLYVLMDSYSRPSTRSRFQRLFPSLFCLGSIIFGAITLQVIEQRSLQACPYHRAN